jgi:hypothetical protein
MQKRIEKEKKTYQGSRHVSSPAVVVVGVQTCSGGPFSSLSGATVALVVLPDAPCRVFRKLRPIYKIKH